MDLSGRALRLTAGDSDTWHHGPVCTEIVHRARAACPAGAGVFHGLEGYGAADRIRTARILSLSQDLPVVVIDAHGRVRAFLPRLDEPVTEGTVTPDGVETVRRAGRGGR